MALHAGNLRYSGKQQRRTERSFSLSRVIPMERLNEAASDGNVRLHITGMFVLGMTTVVAVLNMI